MSHEEEATGSGWSGGDEEPDEKKRDVASESNGHRSPPPSAWETEEGSMSMLHGVWCHNTGPSVRPLVLRCVGGGGG